MKEPEVNQSDESGQQKELGLFDILIIGIKDLADLLRDIRFAAVLLVVTAFATLFGTVLPQSTVQIGTLDPALVETFGENLYLKLIKPLGLDHVFSTVWYRFVLLLLVASVTLCAWSRTKAAVALSKIKSILTSEKGVQAFKHNGRNVFDDREIALNWVETRFKNLGFKLFKDERDNETHFFARKNLTSKWMLVAMHYSFVLILIGAIIGGLFGWKEMIAVGEGDTWSRKEGGKAIKLVDYWVEFDAKDFRDELSYFMAMPSDYKSKIQTLDENGNLLGEKVIEVNYPLKFDGLKFYQTSWQYEPILSIFKNGELINRFVVERDKPFAVGETDKVLFIPVKQIISGFRITGNPDGTKSKEEIPPTCIIYELLHEEASEGQTPVKPVEHPGSEKGLFKKGQTIQFIIDGDKYDVVFEGMNEYTILEVKSDPGVGVVFFGFLVCVIGATLGLMLPYGTGRILVRKQKEGWEALWGVTLSNIADSLRKN